MQAVVKTKAAAGPSATEIRTVPVPVARPGRGADPGARDRRLRLGQAHLPVGPVHGEMIKPPRIYGHEFCGEIVAFGPGGKRPHLEVGMYVSAEMHVTCGQCRPCRHGPAPHLREHAHPGSPRRRLFRAVRRRSGAQRRPARPQGRAAAGRRLPRRPGQRGPHDAGRRPLRPLRRRAGLRPHRRHVRGDRALLGRFAHRHHRGQRATPPPTRASGRDERRANHVTVLDLPKTKDPVGQPARRDGRRRRRRPRALRRRVVDQSRPGRRPPRRDRLLLGLPREKAVTIQDYTNDFVFKGLTMRAVIGRRVFETWIKMLDLLQAGLDVEHLVTNEFEGLEEFHRGDGAARRPARR